LKDSIIIC